MLANTDHPEAPWQVIAAESKPYARAAVLESVISRIEDGLRELGRKPVQIEAAL
jgi:polyphosphate kinase 2 (PPK2 family)